MISLPNYIDENIKLIFTKYFDKYCKYEDVLKSSREIISDINYFNEHISRTKKSNFFNYTIIPSRYGCIHNNFVKQLGENIIYCLHNENEVLIYVSIYKIMEGIFSSVYEENSISYIEYNEFNAVLNYYLNNENDNCLNNFIGCSHSLNDFIKKLNEMRNIK